MTRSMATVPPSAPGELVLGVTTAHRLGLSVGDKVEAAYRRGNLFEKRVLLMSDWATFLENKKAGSRSR